MAFFKNFLIAFFVFASINLCLAKPKWIWVRADEVVDKIGNTEREQHDIDLFGRFEDVLKTERVCTSADIRDCLYVRKRSA
jgi:hypothetical protein